MTNDGMIEKLAKNDREANVAVRDYLSLMQKWRGLELTPEQIERGLRQEAAKLARRQFKAVGT